MNFSDTDNNLFSRLLTTWNSREDLRVADAPLAERVEATIAIDNAQMHERALHQVEIEQRQQMTGMVTTNGRYTASNCAR